MVQGQISLLAYQYLISNLVSRPGGLRTLTAHEREVRLGFEWGHTAGAMPKSVGKARPSELEDMRCSLLGNTFSCPVVGWLFVHFLLKNRLVASLPSVEDAWSTH
eukprot:1878406-Karenia_brevis.AAC.1